MTKDDKKFLQKFYKISSDLNQTIIKFFNLVLEARKNKDLFYKIKNVLSNMEEDVDMLHDVECNLNEYIDYINRNN